MVRTIGSELRARVLRLLKAGLLMCTLALLVPMPATAQKTPTLGKAFVVAGGQTTAVSGTKLSITVNAVADSRCPKYVRCAWQGNARVRLAVVKLPSSVPIFTVLNTVGGANYPRERVVHGYVIRLMKLSPYPGTTKKSSPRKRGPMELKDRRVTLLVRMR